MAIIICPECEGKISDKAMTCPHCGFPLQQMQKTKCDWIPLEKRINIPSVINREYETLKELVESEDTYGALFKLRDIYEIIMKVPTIMSLVIICNNYDKESVSEENSLKFKEILAAMLSGPLAMGSWQNLMAVIKKQGETFGLGETLKKVLNQTNKCLNQKVGEYTSVAQWRNETIGHGTLMIKKTDEYWDEVVSLVEVLNKYFRGEFGKKPLNELYKNVYIKADGVCLQGNNTIDTKPYIHKLYNEGVAYCVEQFMYPTENNYYFFDSFYSGKQKTKITDYVSHSQFLEHDLYYKELYKLYEAMVKVSGKVKLSSKYTTQMEQKMFDCLNEAVEYEKPQYLFDAIKSILDEMPKGIIILQMERGMGKSAFAHDINGAYLNEYINEDLNAVIRTYHLGEIKYKGIGDFYISPINNFKTTGADKGNLRVPDDERYSGFYDNLTNRKNIASSIAGLMDIYREIYLDLTDAEELKIIYVIDGIDELGEDTREIVDNIPGTDELKDGCYIILTSRLVDEKDVSDVSSKIIKELIDKFGTDRNQVVIKSDNEKYLISLKKYIDRLVQGIPSLSEKISEENKKEIIKNSNKKFLYVRPYLELGDAIIGKDGIISARYMVQKYINKISSMYFGQLLEMFELVVASIAFIGQISLEELCEKILFTEISYEAIGCINDLSPLLTERRENGNCFYEYANVDYREYVLDSFPEVISKVIKRLKISFQSWVDIIKDAGYIVSKEIQFYIKVIELIYLYETERLGSIKSYDIEYLRALDGLIDEMSCSVNESYCKARITYILIKTYEELLDKNEQPKYFNPLRFSNTPEHFDWDQIIMESPWELLRKKIKYAALHDENILNNWIDILLCPVRYNLFMERTEEPENPFYYEYAEEGKDNQPEREIVEAFISEGKQDVLLKYLLKVMKNDLLGEYDYFGNERPKRTSRAIYLQCLIDSEILTEEDKLSSIVILLGTYRQMIEEGDDIFPLGFKDYGRLIEKYVTYCKNHNYDYKANCPRNIEDIEDYISSNFCKSILSNVCSIAKEKEFYYTLLGLNMDRFEMIVEKENALYDEYLDAISGIKDTIVSEFIENVSGGEFEKALLILPGNQGVREISLLDSFFARTDAERRKNEVTEMLNNMAILVEKVGTVYISDTAHIDIMDNFYRIYRELLDEEKELEKKLKRDAYEDLFNITLSKPERIYAIYCEGRYEGKKEFANIDLSDSSNPFLYVTSDYGVKYANYLRAELKSDEIIEWTRKIDMSHEKLQLSDYFINSKGEKNSYFSFYLQDLYQRIKRNDFTWDGKEYKLDYLGKDEIQSMANGLVIKVREYIENALNRIEKVINDTNEIRVIQYMLEELSFMKENQDCAATTVVKSELNYTVDFLLSSILQATKIQDDEKLISWLQYLYDILNNTPFTYGFFEYDKNEWEAFAMYNKDYLDMECKKYRETMNMMIDKILG